MQAQTTAESRWQYHYHNPCHRFHLLGPSPSERASAVDTPLRIEFMHLDLASLDSVSHFAAQYREKGYPLHVLFCNDAVIQIPRGKDDSTRCSIK